MRRHTTKEPRGPATAATPRPAKTARQRKSSMPMRLRRRDGTVMAVVMVVRIEREAIDRAAEERAISGIAAHHLGQAAAADMMIEADDMVRRRHDEMEVMRDEQHAAAALFADAADQREELGLPRDIDALHGLV